MSILQNVLLMPLSLVMIMALQNLKFANRFVEPVLLKLTAETHLPYYLVFAWFLAYHLATGMMACMNKKEECSRRCAELRQSLGELSMWFMAAFFISVLCKTPFQVRFSLTAHFVLSQLMHLVMAGLNLKILAKYCWMTGWWVAFILLGWSVIPGFDSWILRVSALLTIPTAFPIRS